MAATLHTLTVQDILWVNLQVTEKVHHFNYARLEEATYYQYAYGDSRTLVPQAARFVTGFLKMHPFDAGNDATAFVGLVAFLRLNGRDLDLADDNGATFLAKLTAPKADARKILESAVVTPHGHGHDDHHLPDVRAAIASVLRAYPKTIQSLVAVTAG